MRKRIAENLKRKSPQILITLKNIIISTIRLPSESNNNVGVSSNAIIDYRAKSVEQQREIKMFIVRFRLNFVLKNKR